MSEVNVISDLAEPKPGTLGHRIHQVEDEHDPEPGTLGHRLSEVATAKRSGRRRQRAGVGDARPTVTIPRDRRRGPRRG